MHEVCTQMMSWGCLWNVQWFSSVCYHRIECWQVFHFGAYSLFKKWIIVSASWFQFYSFSLVNVMSNDGIKLKMTMLCCSIRASYQLNTYLLIYEWHPLELDSIFIRLDHSIKTIWNSIVIWKFASVILKIDSMWSFVAVAVMLLLLLCAVPSILCWYTSLSQLFQHKFQIQTETIQHCHDTSSSMRVNFITCYSK